MLSGVEIQVIELQENKLIFISRYVTTRHAASDAVAEMQVVGVEIQGNFNLYFNKSNMYFKI